MYPTVVCMGISQAIILATSMNMIGEMIGPKSKKAGIVYGVYSFFDKITNGIIIFLIMVSLFLIFNLFFRIHNYFKIKMKILLELLPQEFQVL